VQATNHCSTGGTLAFHPLNHLGVRIILAVVLVGLVIITIASDIASAQVAGATLSGTVTDPSGGFIPNAQVMITNVATAVTRTVSSDSAGFFSAPNLVPGDYEVTTTAPGFSTRVQSGITLTVGA